MTKCTFHKFETSGNIEKHDALCILPINIGIGFYSKRIRWKSCSFQWMRKFTFLFGSGSHPWVPVMLNHLLQDCHCVQPVHQVLHSVVEIQVRYLIVTGFYVDLPFCRRVKKECIDTVIGKSYVGDWLLFYLLGQNIDSVAFKVILFRCLSFYIILIILFLRMLSTNWQKGLDIGQETLTKM